MGRYRKIDPRIWNDQKFRLFSDNAKLAFLFILTHPYMTSLGAMRATISGLAEELHWDLKAFTKVFQEPLLKGMLKYDSEASCLVVPNFLKYNPPENPNVVKSWEKIVDLIPECQLKIELFEYVKDFLKDLGEPFLKPIAKELERVCQNPNPNPNPIKSKPLVSPDRGNGVDEEFEIWWKAYPPRRKQGKPVAKAKWHYLRKTGKLLPLEQMLATLEVQKQSVDWTKESGEYIPGPVPYLNGNKFLDESISPSQSGIQTKIRHGPDCPRCKGTQVMAGIPKPDGSPTSKECDYSYGQNPKTPDKA